MHTVYFFLHTKGYPQTAHVNTFWGKAFQLWSVQLFIQPCWSFQDTHTTAFWRKTLCVQSVRLLLQQFKQSEEAHAYPHWWEAVCLQEMWLCMCTVLRFEEAHEKACIDGAGEKKCALWKNCLSIEFAVLRDSYFFLENRKWKKKSFPFMKIRGDIIIVKR